MADLDNALILATKHFKGITDKSGAPYVLHCLRVMMTVETMEQKMVAVMHDLVEDTPFTLENVREHGFSEDVVNALALVTHDANTSYADYIVAAKANPIARQVKLADLKDNTSLERLLFREDRAETDRKRIQKYVLSYQFLTDKIDETSYRRQMVDFE